MEKTNLIFNIVNTLTLVVGGCLGYFLIEKHYVTESKSNVELATSEMTLNQAQLGLYLSEKVSKDLKAEFAPLNEALDLAKKNGEVVLNLSQARLNEVNRELAKVELNLQETNAKIDLLSKKANITLDVSKLINDIQPNVKPSCVLSKRQRFDFICSFENIGAQKVFIAKPTIQIFNLSSGNKIDPSNYRIEGIDSNVVSAGGSGSNRMYISDIGGALTEDFKIRIKWDVYLNGSVKSAVFPLLNDVLDNNILESLTKQGYTFNFTWRYQN